MDRQTKDERVSKAKVKLISSEEPEEKVKGRNTWLTGRLNRRDSFLSLISSYQNKGELLIKVAKSWQHKEMLRQANKLAVW